MLDHQNSYVEVQVVL